MLDVGDKVPDLPLQLAHAGEAKLSDYRKRWLVLYFYPKDNTPGCTTEGNNFNALLPKFAALNADILGVSRDSVKTHQNFCAKQGFEFDLHSDADEAVCNAFGVIQEKSMYGKKMMGIVRSTFLINPSGKIEKVWSPVKVKEHAASVLDALVAAQK